jgi:hypothetical protein
MLSKPLASSLSLALALSVAACGGKAGGEPGPVGPGAGSTATADLDLTIPEVAVEGMLFAPEALGRPAMVQVTRGKTSLAAQRKKVARKPVAAEVQLLVSLLWTEADKQAAKKPDQAAALREEARTALRALVAAAPKDADAVTLQMMAVAELTLGDLSTATIAYEELVARFPDHEGAMAFKTWLAYLYVQQHRVADARKLTDGWKPAEVGPLAAYAQAWAAFAARDYAVANVAIRAAAVAWPDPTSRVAVERDLVLMLARGGAEVADASAAVAEVAGKELKHRYLLMFNLSESYKFAGYFDRAAAALDVLIDDVLKGEVPPDDLVAFRFRQADYAFRNADPTAAAERAIQAYQGLAACAEKCAGETAEAVTARLAKLAQFSHGVYAATQDATHLAAALSLYKFYIALPGRSDTDTVKGYLKNLQDTEANAAASQGKHTDKIMGDYTLVRREVLAACYEAVRVGAPDTTGAVTVNLEVAASGEVSGASSDPAGGKDGLAAVAGCVTERVRAWHFPSRSMPGVTRVSIPVMFKPLAKPAAAKPAAAKPAQ